MIGFAERGEMVINAQPNTVYDLPDEIELGRVLHGAYQLEMRRGTHFGVELNTAPPGLQLLRSFDTNHRFGESLTVIAPDPA